MTPMHSFEEHHSRGGQSRLVQHSWHTRSVQQYPDGVQSVPGTQVPPPSTGPEHAEGDQIQPAQVPSLGP
jgi:hypothetical protein